MRHSASALTTCFASEEMTHFASVCHLRFHCGTETGQSLAEHQDLRLCQIYIWYIYVYMYMVCVLQVLVKIYVFTREFFIENRLTSSQKYEVAFYYTFKKKVSEKEEILE